MSKQCKIVEDLLPLYHDGVCSEESRQMVDEHLAQCEDCRKILDQIDGELVSPQAKDADIKPLKNISKAVKKGKKEALITGISIALIVILVLFGGVSLYWYTQFYSYYVQFSEGHLPLVVHKYAEDGNILETHVMDDSEYTWKDDTYAYRVNLPSFLSFGGNIDMERLDNTEQNSIGLAISKWEGKRYVFHVFITDGDAFGYFILDKDLNLYGNYSASQMKDKEEMLDNYREELQTIVNDATAMWPFIN